MNIRNPKTGEVIVTGCTGCMCHDLPIRFGSDEHTCEECGCPKTEKGWADWVAEHQPSKPLAYVPFVPLVGPLVAIARGLVWRSFMMHVYEGYNPYDLPEGCR